MNGTEEEMPFTPKFLSMMRHQRPSTHTSQPNLRDPRIRSTIWTTHAMPFHPLYKVPTQAAALLPTLYPQTHCHLETSSFINSATIFPVKNVGKYTILRNRHKETRRRRGVPRDSVIWGWKIEVMWGSMSHSHPLPDLLFFSLFCLWRKPGSRPTDRSLNFEWIGHSAVPNFLFLEDDEPNLEKTPEKAKRHCTTCTNVRALWASYFPGWTGPSVYQMLQPWLPWLPWLGMGSRMPVVVYHISLWPILSFFISFAFWFFNSFETGF